MRANSRPIGLSGKKTSTYGYTLFQHTIHCPPWSTVHTTVCALTALNWSPVSQFGQDMYVMSHKPAFLYQKENCLILCIWSAAALIFITIISRPSCQLQFFDPFFPPSLTSFLMSLCNLVLKLILACVKLSISPLDPSLMPWFGPYVALHQCVIIKTM